MANSGWQVIFNWQMLVSMLILVVGTACTPPTPPPSPTPQSTPTPPATTTPVKAAATTRPAPTITRTPTPTPTPAVSHIIVWEDLPQAQAKALAEDITAFQKTSPGVLVTLRHYRNPENFMTPLQTGEIEFDVALVPAVLMSNLWTADQLAPMSDFFASTFLDNFASITLQGASREGQFWGLADTAGFHLLLYYNRDLVDTPPGDTKQLAKLAQILDGPGQAFDQVLGLNSYEPLWLVPWLSAYGGWLTDAKGRPTLNTAAMRQALTLYQNWHDPASGITTAATYDDMRAQFAAGNLPLAIDGDWAIGELARATNIDWAVAPLPGLALDQDIQPAQSLVLARYWVISQSTSGDKAKAAASLLEFLTRPDQQLERTLRFGLLPTRREALDDPIIVNDSALRLSSEQMLAGRAIPLGANPDALLNAMREPLRQMLAGKITPEEAARMMQANTK